MPDQPSVGQVVNGYRFRGGDPAQQGSWELVQATQQPAQRQPQGQWPAGAMQLPNGSVVMRGPRGGMTNLGRMQPDFTEAAAKAGEFASRMQGAENALGAIEWQTGRQNRDLGDATLSNFGAGQEGTAGPLNFMRSTENQQLEQAQREWIAALLRKDTGAAVTPQEFQLYGPMYLPQPGDSPEVIAQKREARERAFRGAVGSSEGHFRFNFGDDTYPTPATGRSPVDTPRFERGRQQARQTAARLPAQPAPAQPTRQQRRAPATPAQRRLWQSLTPAQRRSVQSIPGGPRGTLGSATNPHIVNGDAQYNRLPSGARFIGPDGQVRTKP